MSQKRKYNDKGQDFQLSEEQLLDYLEGKLTPGQQHFIEEVLQDDPFLSDAIDGLAAINNKEQISHITAQLNLRLRRQIKEKKANRRERRRLKPDKQAWLYIVILLLLIVLSWIVIEKAL